MKKIVLIIILGIIIITFVSSEDFGFDNADIPSLRIPSGNITTYQNNTYNNITNNFIGGNTTFNQTLTDSLYIHQDEESNLNVNSTTWWSGLTGWVSGWFFNDGDELNFNETKLNETIDLRAGTGGNVSWNQTFANTLYAGIEWGYNMSDGSYNATYDNLNSSQWISSGNDIYYNDGKVGINTVIPSYDLDVNGTIRSEGVFISNDNPYITQEDVNGGANDKRMQWTTNGGLSKFKSRNDDNSIRVDDIIVMDMGSGYVGIGTYSPSTILDVNGNITARDCIITSNGGKICTYNSAVMYVGGE